MGIFSEKSLYPGVNPHLNSALQQPGGAWRSFHTYMLTYTAQLLNRTLPQGYYAQPEQSLQNCEYYDEDTPIAVLIYTSSKPVTRIELLSPANKPGGSHFRDYATARDRALDAGLRLVEIDLLHERPPITTAIPSYRLGKADAYPYSILVSDPRPTREDGTTKYYGFRVADALPTIEIPLEEKATTALALAEVYAMTFAERPFYTTVDYAQLPVNFDSYDAVDQETIRERMAQVKL